MNQTKLNWGERSKVVDLCSQVALWFTLALSLTLLFGSGTAFAQVADPLTQAVSQDSVEDAPGIGQGPNPIAFLRGDSQPYDADGPTLRMELEAQDLEEGRLVPALRVGILLMVLSLLPAILISVTSFTRIVIVLSFVRTALGTASLPPNQVLLGLAVFLTIFTMNPVLQDLNEQVLTPYQAQEITDAEALDLALPPIRSFMARHTRSEDLALMISMVQEERPRNFDEVSTFTLVPAYMLSELRTAFIMGALILIPFVLIDLIVASVLMAMGMMMVPPVMVSLPLKVLLFVLADGWNLVVGSLAQSVLQ